jgi:hypothetical protein
MYKNFIAFATVDPKTQTITWLEPAQQVINSFKHKDKISIKMLEMFILNHTDYCSISQLPNAHIYAYHDRISEGDFIKNVESWFGRNPDHNVPLTEQQKEQYKEMLLNADEESRALSKFGEDILECSYDILFLDDMYYLIGVAGRIIDFKCNFWELGKTVEAAKESLVQQYYHVKYGDKELPYSYRQRLEEASYHYQNYSSSIRSMVRSLNLSIIECQKFIEQIERDFQYDGGINTENIVIGKWVNKMVEAGVSKYRTKGQIKKM